MRAPYRWRHDPRYYLAALLCWHHGHREEDTGTHRWCSRCGSAWGWDELPPGLRGSLP